MRINEATLVIFGGTGDLTIRKLVPALFQLKKQGTLPQSFKLFSIGRRSMDEEAYRSYLLAGFKKHSNENINTELWDEFAKQIFYFSLPFENESGYVALDKYIHDQGAFGRRSYYLAVSPNFFAKITNSLKSNNMHRGTHNGVEFSHSVIIEKPFGENLETAMALNEVLSSAFAEEDIFRIDHYLGKEMIQNILSLRFSNIIFEPIWNSKYVDHVQITSFEKNGIDSRGEYYDSRGVLLDMVQNHMLQLLTLTAMEPPLSLEANDIRDEKVRVLRSITTLDDDFISKNTIRGQYTKNEKDGVELKGYLEENNVNPKSTTETFMGLRLNIDNARWAGVPFYIRTGKRMNKSYTTITVVFKNLPELLYKKKEIEENKLTIYVQPTEGISLSFNAKEMGLSNLLKPVAMDYVHASMGSGNTPQAYEKLLLDIFAGDNTLFTRWDELYYAWKLTDTISNVWKSLPAPYPYKACDGDGPAESNEFMKSEGRVWIDESTL